MKSRTGKWWLAFLMWLKDFNRKITPLGAELHGAFTIFKRQTVEQIGGFNPVKPKGDTAFDLKLKARGWEVKRVRDVVVRRKVSEIKSLEKITGSSVIIRPSDSQRQKRCSIWL